MAVTDTILSRLRRTLLTIFGIGTINVKDNSGVAELRDEADSAYAVGGMHTARLHGSNASHYIGLSAPAGLGAAATFVLPAADGTAGQVIKTDGSLNLSFADAISNAEMTQSEAFTQATSSPLTLFTPPANSEISKIQLVVTVAAAAGTPTVSIGIDGDVDRDLDETDVDLLTLGIYEIFPNTAVGETPGAMKLTITPDSQTFSGTVRVWYSTPA